MNVFVLNRGSSSIKCYLYQGSSKQPKWEAHVQWKNNFEDLQLVVQNERKEMRAKNGKEILKEIVQLISFEEIDVIGHRIVHGGKYFTKSVQVNEDVKKKIALLAELAPLHNLPELEGIEILEKLFPKKPQVAVFDTAFHHTLPKAAQIYPGPYRWYEEGIQRYGFHGISFQYCYKRAAEILEKDLKASKVLICHLGSGASLCAIKEGKSIDTTMGYTPLEGLMMDTRSGSIDPGILLHLLEKKSAKEISKELYDESGLLGLSGISSDMRDIIEKSQHGNQRAKLALDVYLHRLCACMGSMIASLQGLDVLVFTAGIGENGSLIRERCADAFSFLGLKLGKREPSQDDCTISAPDSKVHALLIHTQEAFEIAQECQKILYPS